MNFRKMLPLVGVFCSLSCGCQRVAEQKTSAPLNPYGALQLAYDGPTMHTRVVNDLDVHPAIDFSRDDYRQGNPPRPALIFTHLLVSFVTVSAFSGGTSEGMPPTFVVRNLDLSVTVHQGTNGHMVTLFDANPKTNPTTNPKCRIPNFAGFPVCPGYLYPGFPEILDSQCRVAFYLSGKELSYSYTKECFADEVQSLYPTKKGLGITIEVTTLFN